MASRPLRDHARRSRAPGGWTTRTGSRRCRWSLVERAAHAAVEGLDGGVEDAAGRVEVAGAEGVGVAGQAGAREGQPPVAACCAETRREPVRLERLVVAVAAGRAVKRPALGGRAGVGPRGPQQQQLGELRPGRRLGIERRGVRPRARRRSPARAARPRPAATAG